MVYSYPLLTDLVASHFDAAGQPNGWMARGPFIALYAGVVALLTIVFCIMGLFIRKVPPHLINLPYRDYWLAPERREASCFYLQDWMLQMGSATLVFLISIMHGVICFNIEQPAVLFRGTGWLIGAFLFFTFVWCIRLFLRFPKPA